MVTISVNGMPVTAWRPSGAGKSQSLTGTRLGTGDEAAAVDDQAGRGVAAAGGPGVSVGHHQVKADGNGDLVSAASYSAIAVVASRSASPP